MPTSGVWGHVHIVFTDVSEERMAFIFRVKYPRARNQLQPPAHAGYSLADFYALKMEAILSFETSVYTASIRRHIIEEGIVLENFIIIIR
jgi:hypothetical protein